MPASEATRERGRREETEGRLCRRQDAFLRVRSDNDGVLGCHEKVSELKPSWYVLSFAARSITSR